MRRPVGPRSIKRAIAIIEDSRQSHERALTDPDSVTIGTRAFHRRCVKEYEEVLKVLRRMAEAL